MSPSSLRFRLTAAALLSIAAALVLAGIGLIALFEDHVERRIDEELSTYLALIIAGVEVAHDRVHFRRDLGNPRFDTPLSGLYWQIRDETHPTLLRSRSLWDQVIELPADALPAGVLHRHVLPGPADQVLLVRERSVYIAPRGRDHWGRKLNHHPRDAGETHRVRVVVAIDRAELRSARNAFATDMSPYLGTIAVMLTLAAWLHIHIGLAPLGRLRRAVTAIRAGRQRHLAGRHPEEVMPLVEEIDALLAAQEQAIERARAWTADLAHGLKTPLSALSADAARLREQGNVDIADDLEELAEAMRRRIDRELIRARLRSGIAKGQAGADPARAIESIVRTLKRTPRGESLAWELKLEGTLVCAVAADDLYELFGNLIENAVEWARKRVRIVVHVESGSVRVQIEDDGPGVPDDKLGSLCERGLRLDQTRGSGLGLAIARDIADAYGCDLGFARAGLGGLAVTVAVPVLAGAGRTLGKAGS